MSKTHSNGESIRWEILRTVMRLQEGSSSYVREEQIADELGLSCEDLQGHLDLLEQEGAVCLSKTLDGYSAYLKPGQRQVAKEALASMAEAQPETDANATESGKPPVPTVFISYSHDSPEHKAWVARLAADIEEEGLEVVFDQEGVPLGTHLPCFMENGIKKADRVCIICTPKYAKKADEGKGGVGYEKQIVTAEMFEDVGSTKFIPVVAEGKDEEAIPGFLKGRKYVDFRDADAYKMKLDELLWDIREVQEKTESPGSHSASAATTDQSATGTDPVSDSPSATARPVPDHPGISPVKVYDTCQELFRREDVVGWKQLGKKLRASLDPGLAAWLESIRGKQFEKIDEFVAEAHSAVDVVMPLMALAVASAESELPAFADQRSLVEDLLSIPNWPVGGLVPVIRMPEALVYVYQHVYGATCLRTGQLQLGVSLGTMSVKAPDDNEHRPLWAQKRMSGYPNSLGGSRLAWNYLLGLANEHSWLRRVFVRDGEWESSLTAYNLLLCILDFASAVSALEKQGKMVSQLTGDIRFDVPPHFADSKQAVIDAAFRLTLREAASTELLAQYTDTEASQLRAQWKAWLDLVSRSGEREFRIAPWIAFPDIP